VLPLEVKTPEGELYQLLEGKDSVPNRLACPISKIEQKISIRVIESHCDIERVSRNIPIQPSSPTTKAIKKGFEKISISATQA
jgi:hypothetical protein